MSLFYTKYPTTGKKDTKKSLKRNEKKKEHRLVMENERK